MKLSIYVAIIVLASACGQTSRQAPNEVDGQWVEDKVKEAYFHCFPIVENYKAIYAYGVDTSSPKYLPMNTMYNTTALYSPKDVYVVSPNNDTYYTTVTADIRAEPLVIRVPEIKDRYYSFQLNSMVTDNFGYIGTNSTGTGAGTYIITSPGFTGELPPGVKEIRSPSDFIGIVGRTQVNVSDPQDIRKALAVQKKYEIGVMHKFYPSFKPKEVDKVSFPSYSPDDMKTTKFFSLLNFLLPYIRLSEQEQKIMDGFKGIGIAAGKPYTYVQEHPELKGNVESGIIKGVEMVDSSARKMGKVVNGWTMFPLGDYFGDHFVDRTNVARMGIYANSPSEAYYPLAFVDGEGNALDGKNAYRIDFPRNALPPVKYFWSLTMYDGKTQLLVENPIHRYSIGDRTKGMKFNKDSSLTIYVGHEPPASGTSNWLPAPASSFNVMMRLYGPREEILNGQWAPPALVLIKK